MSTLTEQNSSAATAIGIGVIAVGGIGRVHADALTRGVPGARLVAVTDVDSARAEAVADAYGAEICADSDAVIGHPDVDAVIVATPTPSHARLTIQAVRAGRHVLCEKPIASTLSEAEQIVVAADQAHVIVQVGFQRRFDLDFRAAAALIDAGRLGRPRLYLGSLREPHSYDGGGLNDFLVHFAIHELDAVRWIMGEVDEVTAIGQGIDDAELPDGDIENVAITLRFASGALGILDVGTSAAYGFDCRAEIMGTTATARVSVGRSAGIEVLEAGHASHAYPLTSAERFAGAHVAQLVAFCRAVRTGSAQGPTAYDGHAALALVEAVERSLRERRTVRLARGGAHDRVLYTLSEDHRSPGERA